MSVSQGTFATAPLPARTQDLLGPYLLFLGDTTVSGYAKTAFGLRDWAPDRCIAEWSLPDATVSTGLPMLSPADAFAQGARARW